MRLVPNAVTADDWSRGYPRELGAYPAESLRRDKYWPPVSRIDNAWGDRHLFCSCPTPEEWVGREEG